MKKYLCLITCFISLTSWSKVPSIRVKVAGSLAEVSVTALDLKRHIYEQNNTKSYSGKKTVLFNCRNDQKSNSKIKPKLLASVSSPSGFIDIDKEKFLGKVDILSSPKKDSCDVIHETDMDTYLSSLLSKEMNGSWPVEALKAQAVVARTYAINKMETKYVNKVAGYESFYDLESSEKHQVGGSFLDITPNTKQASRETSGLVLEDPNGVLTPTFFHAKCGGKTLLPFSVWGRRVAGYQSVPCEFCTGHGKKEWKSHFSKNKLLSFFKWMHRKGYLKNKAKIGNISQIKMMQDKHDRGSLRIYVSGKSYKIVKSLFRKYFGRFKVQSNNFLAKIKGNSIHLMGKGKGHAVGMCQLGALELAKRGWKYDRILSYYFPSHKLKKVY